MLYLILVHYSFSQYFTQIIDILFMEIMELGSKIKKVRELRNYTQEYMADKLNVSQSTYSRFEKDDTDITISQLNKIAEVLDVKINDLISFNDKYVFNNYGEIKENQYGNIQNNFPIEMKNLYEKTIQLLEEKIKDLQQKIKE